MPPSPSVQPAPGPMPPSMMQQMGEAQQANLGGGSQVKLLGDSVENLKKAILTVGQIAAVVHKPIMPYLAVMINAGTEIEKQLADLQAQDQSGAVPPPSQPGVPPTEGAPA